MANDGTGVHWDVTDPANSAVRSDGAKQIRDLRLGVGLRLAYEHTAAADTSVGGVHKPGSAVSYVAETAPTTRPDGSTLFTSADIGRIWMKTSTGALSVLTATTPTWTPAAGTGGGGGGGTSSKAATIQDQKAHGTDGGSFTSGSWQQRVLNTLSDPESIVTSLVSNQFILPAGTYTVIVEAPALQVDIHQVRLQNVTDGTFAYGMKAFTLSAGSEASSTSVLHIVFTISGAKTFQVDHRCQTTKTFQGLGYGNAGDFGNVEVYTSVMITKLH